MTRTMLINLGTKSVVEAADGLEALEAMRISDPDLMLLDWDANPQRHRDHAHRAFARCLSASQDPDHHVDQPRSRPAVLHALRAGAHEFLVKPTSAKALRDRLTAIALRPRPMMRLGHFYVLRPQRLPPVYELGSPTR